MNINQIKPIRQLPELEDHQEWTCEHGCDDIEPRLFKSVYAESKDENGVKTRELFEHYYTCQNGHVLEVWDNNANECVTLPDEAYQNREVPEGANLPNIENLIVEMQAQKARMISNLDSLDQKIFKFAKVSFELTFKSGEVLSVDEHCLNEIKAQLLETESSKNEARSVEATKRKQGKCSCGFWLKNAIGGKCGECGELIKEWKESHE
jgi:hypothetical protein